MTTVTQDPSTVKPHQYTRSDYDALYREFAYAQRQAAKEKRWRGYEMGSDYNLKYHQAEAVVRLSAQGRLIKAETKHAWPVKNSHEATFHRRGKVINFSQGSRRRCLNFAQTIDSSKTARFLTLTYQDVQNNAQKAKNHLRALLKRLMRHCASEGMTKTAFWWRMELQERGAIHFHIIMWGTGFIHWKLIRQWWGEIASLDFTRPVNIKIESLHTHKKLFQYVSKYVAKTAPSSNFNSVTYLAAPGRVWGVEGRANVPVCELQVVWIDAFKREIWFVRDKAAETYQMIDKNPCYGFTLYIDDAIQWLHQRLVDYPNLIETDLEF